MGLPVLQAEARLGLGPNGKFNASAIPEVRAAGANYEQTLAKLKQAEANEKRYRELTETGDVSSLGDGITGEVDETRWLYLD